MTTAQTEFTPSELLADHDIAEPLVAGGVLCHGGFDDQGRYVSPRTRNRWPAIHAWEEQRRSQFATPLLDVPLDTWPENFPNVAQSKLLIRAGAPDAVIVALTRIGTVEGFGGMLRLLAVPDVSSAFAEDVTGTAVAHIDRGLFEAHARDESGFGDQAGHDRMWFVARDIAFEHPVEPRMRRRASMARMGIGTRPGSPTPGRSSRATRRVLPGDIDPALETLVSRMVGLLLIEISAFHGFRWAEEVLGDSDLVAGDGAAGTLVSYIRRDETPHVAWLRTALSEMRDRTWVGTGGRTHAGVDMIGRLWDRALRDSLLVRRRDNLQAVLAEIEASFAGRPDADDLMEELLSLGQVVRAPDGTLSDRPALDVPEAG